MPGRGMLPWGHDGEGAVATSLIQKRHGRIPFSPLSLGGEGTRRPTHAIRGFSLVELLFMSDPALEPVVLLDDFLPFVAAGDAFVAQAVLVLLVLAILVAAFLGKHAGGRSQVFVGEPFPDPDLFALGAFGGLPDVQHEPQADQAKDGHRNAQVRGGEDVEGRRGAAGEAHDSDNGRGNQQQRQNVKTELLDS